MEDAEAAANRRPAIALRVPCKADARLHQVPAVLVELMSRARPNRGELEALWRRRSRSIAIEVCEVAVALEGNSVELIPHADDGSEARRDLPRVLREDSPLTLHEARQVVRLPDALAGEELVLRLLRNRARRPPDQVLEAGATRRIRVSVPGIGWRPKEAEIRQAEGIPRGEVVVGRSPSRCGTRRRTSPNARP